MKGDAAPLVHEGGGTPGGPVRSLDARYYTDPDIFEQEKDAVMGLSANRARFACLSA